MKADIWKPLATLLLHVVFGATSPVQLCPSNSGGVCFSIAVPTSSANAGSGNIYFQIKAPTSLQWVALGTGSSMTGSNIFVMYQDGKGNLTLSPRRGTGHSMPTLDTSSTAAQLTLLAGSGVEGSTMTANIACSNCQTWNGGEMSLTSTSAAWIGGWRQGSSLATTDRGASIVQHDSHVQFNVDLTQAAVASDSNPFVATSEVDNSDGSGSDGNPASPSNGSAPDPNPGIGGGAGSGGITVTTGMSRGTILVAHGVIMALVFAALYPLGSMLMPLFRKWWLHAGIQTIAFCLMWTGFGLGVETARERRMLFNQAHTVLGTVIVALLGIQPALGYLHHRHYLKTQGRGVISYVHIWWGRILIALGVINGGMGLRLVGERGGLVIAYGVIAGVLFLAYAGAKIFRLFRQGERLGPKPAEMNGRPSRTTHIGRRRSVHGMRQQHPERRAGV
ncbi:uncharacterized protein B0T15DRAFT_19471 [Chaetomium strumarium]|uniref:DOMON domain-containing protein n=1 Tax=Chaetomium strumarium TaxID=1170767 RepID=A0AAJ0H179_9PEZI|nr:hypothetical protein B0T15DRAFT_19471 [Chaetomium strumarium]